MNPIRTIITSICILFLSIFSVPVLATDEKPLTEEELRKAQLVAYELVLQSFIAWESAEAYEPYFNGNFEVAKHSLTHLARILDYLQDKKIAKDYAQQDLAFIYIHLGKIAETENNEILAKDYYEKGLSTYNEFRARNAREGYTFEKLRALIDKLDENTKNSGRLMPESLREVLPNPKMEPNTKMKADD